jgi:S-adenosylmethionine synthetase
MPVANDTSIGVGYAPLSNLERLVLAVEKRMNARDRQGEHPAWGEDIKVMGVRSGSVVRLTIACAMIGRYLARVDDYLNEKTSIEALVQWLATQHGFPGAEVVINAADDVTAGAVYLTVTGTSAEMGDDGQVGRGNRVNGLITPCQPMTLEAVAGKNPVTHVGKLYNVVAREIAEALVAIIPDVAAAHCLIVSQIGAPVTNPALLHVRLRTRDELPIADLKHRVEEIAVNRLDHIPHLIDDFVDGSIDVF